MSSTESTKAVQKRAKFCLEVLWLAWQYRLGKIFLLIRIIISVPYFVFIREETLKKKVSTVGLAKGPTLIWIKCSEMIDFLMNTFCPPDIFTLSLYLNFLVISGSRFTSYEAHVWGRPGYRNIYVKISDCQENTLNGFFLWLHQIF